MKVLSPITNGLDEVNKAYVDGSIGVAVDSSVPYFIPSSVVFTVFLYKQALFTIPIDIEGDINVDGILIEI